MAYTPVSKKKTSGYVPVTKAKTTISQALDKQFPAREMIRNVSYIPVSQKPKSRVEQNKEFETRTGEKAPFANTTKGIAVNTVLGLPKAALDVAREIPRGFAGTAAQIVAPAIGIKQEDISLQPEGLMKKVLGDKPIQPAKEGADLLKLIGISDETAKKYGPILYAGLTLSDFVSIPGKKKAVVEAIKMAGDAKQANIVLKNAGIPDDVVKTFNLTDKVVSAKTDADVELIFKNIPKEVMAKSTPLPKLTKTETPTTPPRIIPESTTSKTAGEGSGVRYNNEMKDKAVQLYKEGQSSTQISKELGVNNSTVLSWTEKAGVKRTISQAKVLYGDDIPKVIDLYKQGKNTTEISKELNLAPSSVARWVKEAGITRSNSEVQSILAEMGKTNVLGVKSKVLTKFGPLHADSTYEAIRIKQLEADPNVIGIKRATRIPLGDGKHYIPDIEIKYKDGSTVIEEIKPVYKLGDEKIIAKEKAAREFLKDSDVGYRIVSENDIGIDAFKNVNIDDFTFGSEEIKSRFANAIKKAQTKTKSQLTDLPTLPKLPEDVRVRLESKQADETINKAIRERYSNAARRSVKEDNALARAAKQPGNIEGVKKITGELLTPISSRLMRINPILRKAIREFEFRVASNTTKNSEEILPLLQATKKMSKVDQSIFDLARKNGDSEVIDALATKYDLHDELNRTRDVLNDIFERAKAVGMDVQYRKDYFPRMVTNPEKFMAYLRGTEDWGIIQRLLDNAAKAKGLKVTDMTPEEQAALVNNLIRGYGDKITLAKPGFTKARTIDVIDDQLNEFYESSDSALSAYVVRMNDEIEGRKFFGKHSKEPIGDAKIEDSIGSYVLDLAAKGEIKPDQIDEVLSIFKARFHRGKMNGAIDVFRNAEYISTMGSPISAITQISDVAYSLYESGFYHTARGMGKAALSKNKLSKEALGIENITQEFTKNTMSGKALNTIFKLTGLEMMDRLGKETLINGYLSKLKSQAKAGDDVLKRELDFMFDSDEAALAMKELAEGKLTDRTKLLAFNKLLDYQPVAKSEMPQKYLEMPNGRIFYTLKSFTIKQYDVFRREAIDDIVSGDKTKIAKGIKNLLLLSGAFVAANATADEIKDLILGRETPMSDKLVDNLWRLVGASKYDVYKARADGIGQTVAKKILFPTSIADRAYKDITNLLEGKEYEKGPLEGDSYKLESTQTIPIGGKLYYWWFGRGDQKEDYKAGSGDSNDGMPALPTLPELPKLPKLPKL